MTLLIDAPPGHDITPGGLICRLCPDHRDVTLEPCTEHGPASTVDTRVDYERLADLATLVMTTRQAAGEDLADAARKRWLSLSQRPLLARWGVIARDGGHGWLVRIHEAHVGLVRTEILRCKGIPPDASPFRHLAMPVLTTRQREVIELVAEGLDNEHIAARLAIAFDTAKTHVSRSMRALGAANRTNLVHVAHLTGVFGAIPQRQPAVAAA